MASQRLPNRHLACFLLTTTLRDLPLGFLMMLIPGDSL
jgi:hypothetical protein